jgi:hypothetical protein
MLSRMGEERLAAASQHPDIRCLAARQENQIGPAINKAFEFGDSILLERYIKGRELTVGVLNHPQSNLGDFYRELAEVFGVSLKPSNRWGGFKTLRERWIGHLEATRVRCCLLIDEAQEMSPKTLLELRLLASARSAGTRLATPWGEVEVEDLATAPGMFATQ